MVKATDELLEIDKNQEAEADRVEADQMVKRFQVGDRRSKTLSGEQIDHIQSIRDEDLIADYLIQETGMRPTNRNNPDVGP